MVNIQIKKSIVRGVIRCPSSKSYSHRAIAIGSLTEGRSVITNVLLSRDTLATLSACRSLGAIINHEDVNLHIEGKHSFETPENIINAENSGTTIRILTAMSALVKKGFTIITGDESLRKRPMQPLIDALTQLGVCCYSSKLNGTAPLIVKGGGIKGGTAIVNGTISSQFISALLISCIYADSRVTIRINGEQVSKPYIEATMATMKAFGVTIDNDPKLLEYYVDNKQYSSTVFDIPADFSAAALILSAGVLVGDKVTINGLNFRLPQGDSCIVDIIRKMGGNIKVDKEKGEVTVYGSTTLEGGDFDLGDTPDLLPVVSILALKARSRVKIRGISHARFKETDRVTNITSQLIKLGAIIKETNNEIEISAPRVLKNAWLEAFNDHRLFMAFTIASMLTEKSNVTGAESIDVSYPSFIQDMTKLQASIKPVPDRE
ncbi:MAG TPA: 3-phosphoshikimate 1-carboxyvinyltransferase [Nitrososphaeraceae archaeon]|nr:3-phosphoshikimate 1-carboxyvinyltransferase [Nitrososphaeraceae archaeon]